MAKSNSPSGRVPTSYRKFFRAWATPEFLHHPHAARVLVHLVVRSAFKDGEIGPDRVPLKEWQAVVSRRSLAKALKMSPSTAWRTLEFLCKQGIVDHQTDQGYSLVTLIQPGLPADPPSRVDHQTDHKRPSVDHSKPRKLDRPQQPTKATPSTVCGETPRKVGPPGNGKVEHSLKSLSLNEGNGLEDLGTSRDEEKNSPDRINPHPAIFNDETGEYEWGN